jgi:hypothetical protein
MKTSALHVHKWGLPWTNHFGIFELSPEQAQLLLEAATIRETKSLQEEKEFATIWNGVDEYVKKHGAVFPRLSTTSAKDTGEPMCCKSVDQVFSLLVKSFRVMEDLESEELGDFAVVLRPWDETISEEKEYRCFIFEGKCEAIAKKSDSSKPEKSIATLLHCYIQEHAHSFPESNVALDVVVTSNPEDTKKSSTLIFVEFNPIDNELDTCGIIESHELSEAAVMLLKREPIVPFPEKRKLEDVEEAE